MVANGQVQRLIDRRISSFKALFSALGVPDPAALAGVHWAEFVGPAWLRKSAPSALVLGGLSGWWGKEFLGPAGATNLVQRQGRLLRVLPMKLIVAPSLLDGRPAVQLHYPPGSRLPWPWILDELRQLDESTLLGMTLVKARRFPRIAFPFVLHKSG